MLQINHLGLQPYVDIWMKMKDFTATRDKTTADEVWLLEHLPVYTQGQAGKPEHILNPFASIPIVQTDRGGQVTYHGPGRLVAYVLIDLSRLKIGIRTLVTNLEQFLLTLLSAYNIQGRIQPKAPGVYVMDKKIASIGLRVRNGCTYHGIAINVAMDLSPFNGINPCGFANLKMTQIRDFVPYITVAQASKLFEEIFIMNFTPNYASIR